LNNQVIATSNGQNSNGAGIYIEGIFLNTAGEILVNGNKIRNNEALSTNPFAVGKGGGIVIANCSPLVFNNLIAGNSAGVGGGLMIYASQGFKKSMKPVLINNTIIHNQAFIGDQINSYGGGIYVKEEHFENLTNPIIINSIIWNNTGDTGSQIYIARGSIDVAYSDIEGGWEGEGNIDVDPQFEDASFQLSDSSLCIGTGIATINISDTLLHCPPSDIEGNPRPDPDGSNPDMGAWENHLPIPTNIISDYSGLPLKFTLRQNYPNPFNPKTTINYELPITNYVKLSIYNLLGQKVATLVDKRQTPGSYQIEWDASDFASGIYYYRINMGEFVDIKKLVLLR